MVLLIDVSGSMSPYADTLLRFIREQSLRLEHQHVLAPTGWAGEDDKVLFTMPMIALGDVLDGTARSNGWTVMASR